MTELRNGDLYLVYYGGAGEYAVDTGVFGSRRQKGSNGVVAARADRPRPVPLGRQRRGLGSARRPRLALLRRPLRRHLVHLEGPGQGLPRPGRDLVGRVDAGARRGHPGPQPADRARQRRLPAAPLPRDRPRHRVDRPRQLFVLPPLSWPRTRPGPRPSRSARPRGTSSRPWSQLTISDLVAYCRRGGDYKPETIGYIVRSESHDGGWTWSEGKDSAFPNPNAAVDFLKLKSGRLLLVYNHSMNRRTPLTVALSSDQDRTWPVRRNLREGRQRLRLPDRLPGGRRPDPRRLHVRPPDRGQPRRLR